MVLVVVVVPIIGVAMWSDETEPVQRAIRLAPVGDPNPDPDPSFWGWFAIMVVGLAGLVVLAVVQLIFLGWWPF